MEYETKSYSWAIGENAFDVKVVEHPYYGKEYYVRFYVVDRRKQDDRGSNF